MAAYSQNAPAEPTLDHAIEYSEKAAAYVKALAHETRLVILASLLEGPKTVTEFENETGARQANISQHLAKMRAQGLVRSERHGKAILYSLIDQDAILILRLLFMKFRPV